MKTDRQLAQINMRGIDMQFRPFAPIAALAALLLCASVVLSDETNASKDSSSETNVATVDGVYTIADLEIDGVQRVVKIWPTELYWGDNIYCSQIATKPHE